MKHHIPNNPSGSGGTRGVSLPLLSAELTPARTRTQQGRSKTKCRCYPQQASYRESMIHFLHNNRRSHTSLCQHYGACRPTGIGPHHRDDARSTKTNRQNEQTQQLTMSARGNLSDFSHCTIVSEKVTEATNRHERISSLGKPRKVNETGRANRASMPNAARVCHKGSFSPHKVLEQTCL